MIISFLMIFSKAQIKTSFSLCYVEVSQWGIVYLINFPRILVVKAHKQGKWFLLWNNILAILSSYIAYNLFWIFKYTNKIYSFLFKTKTIYFRNLIIYTIIWEGFFIH